MESEKVKEIKNWLENESEVYRNEIAYNTLDLINELESENESCYEVLADLKVIIKQQNDRIAELEKENETKTVTITDLLNKQEFYEKEKLKQFVERLKEKAQKSYINVGGITATARTVTLHDIDETLKEFINEESNTN